MFRTNIYLFNSSTFGTSSKNKANNFYGDLLTDLPKKQLTYYGFDRFIKKVKFNNPLIPSERFDSEVPKPFSYLYYPFYFEKFLVNNVDSVSFYDLFKFNKIEFFKILFLKYFCSIFNITPYVNKTGFFRVKTFSGFTFVTLWFNLHFFLPYVFGNFSEDDIKGTFYDKTFPTIRMPRQVFCNFFYSIFSMSTNKNKFTKFIFIYLFILLIPIIFLIFLFFLFFSIFFYFIFFILWRDRFVIKDYFHFSKNSFVYFEFWHVINFFYDKLYQFYVSSFTFFSEFPKSSNAYDENDVDKALDTKYVNVANRVFYYSPVRYFFRRKVGVLLYRLFFFFFNFFGVYHFSQLNDILNGENFSNLFKKRFEKFIDNKLLNKYDRLFLFKTYVSNNETSKSSKISNFEFYAFTEVYKNQKLYENSIFKWPLLNINTIAESEYHSLYKNWHFSKFNVEFEKDFLHFPYIDPDFSNFYSKELVKNKRFLSSFSKHDLDRLYGYRVWRTSRIAKFNTSKLWQIFYTFSNNVDPTIDSNILPNSCYDNILNSTNSRISYFFSRFGVVFIPDFSIFSFFTSFFSKIFSFFLFFYHFFDSFFCFSSIFSFFTSFKKSFYHFFSKIFYNLYFFFLKSSTWSFFPFFDYFKNFYINFYTFYNYTNFIRAFYFERSVNKTFFMEGLEELDDEETHFTDTIEQSFYNYWWQDFEVDLDAINFFHDEVYDQFTDVFDYEDDEMDYLNTLYLNDDDVVAQHYDFEAHGLDNFRDSDSYFSDEVEQEDFEDSYEDLEHFFSPVEESSSIVSDDLFTSVFIIRSIIYDVSDMEKTFPLEQYFNGFGPYGSFELRNASYDLYASFWRIYLYNYWDSNVPINDDFKRHVNSQLSRYVSYLDKWHTTQLSSGKYIKIPNIIRSFGPISYVNKNFSRANFEKLTVELNNTLFPRSIIKKIYFPEQIEIIWNKVGRFYDNNPNYVISVLEKPGSAKIFDLISKSGFEFKVSKSSSHFFYAFENFFIKIYKKIFDKAHTSKYEREFIINFFGQFYNTSNFKGLSNFPPELVKNILDIVNNINKASEKEDFYPNPFSFLSSKNKFNFVEINLFGIITSLLLFRFIRKWEEITDYPDGTFGYNNRDDAYSRLINLFSSIQFSSKRFFYNYLKIIVKKYVSHHRITGEFSVVFKKDDLYNEVLNTSTQEHTNLASFEVLADLGLFWSDLAPNIKKVYKAWNDPFLASLFFPEQFYVLLDLSNISTFDDEEIDMYEEPIDYFTETSTGDLYDDPYEKEVSPILEDTSADPDEENFFRGEAVVTTTLYEDLFDEDDEYFNPDMHWYEQIEDEPEFDEWDIDFFDEIEDINIPIERVFFGEFYRKFITDSKFFGNDKISSTNRFDRTSFYSHSKNKTFFGYSNFSKKNITALSPNIKFENSADIYFTKNNIDNEKVKGNFLGYFVSRVFKFVFYFYYFFRNFTWFYSIEYASSLRKPLTIEEELFLSKHYRKNSHLYNDKFFVEFKNFILNWIKTYESFNSESRLKHIVFEIIRSNLKLDNSIQSPLFHSPYSFSWFEDSNMPTDFKWEFYYYFKNFFDLDARSASDEDFTVLMDDFIKDFYNSEEMQNIKKEHGHEYFEDVFEFGLFILSSFVIEHEDPYFYSENFFYSTLINLYFSRNKKYPLHSDLYFQDLYRVFEDDWNAIQNDIGFYKEDSSAWLNLLDNPPEDDYIEDPVTPFYVSEEQVVHSSKEYTNKFMIFLDATWEFFALIFDYHLHWVSLVFDTYIISYYEAISAFFDKSWFNLAIKYGSWVYLIRSFFSFSFFIICSLYIVFVIPRIVFIYTTSYFQIFFSIFFSGIVSFFFIMLLSFTLFFSVYQAYKDINEYERSSFYFASFISWFTVVWYSIVGYDIYETDDSSSNIFPSVDPDPTLSPDSAMLEINTPEIIDFDPNYDDYEGGSAKPLLAPQPVTFGYFVDTFFAQYLNVSHRSLTGHKFRQKFTFMDPFVNRLTSDNIGNYVQHLRRKNNFSKGGKGIYGHYASERGINNLTRYNNRSNALKAVSAKNNWVKRYSDLRYNAQHLSRIRRLQMFRNPVTIDYNWHGVDPIFSYKEDDREMDQDKYYKGKSVYTSVTDHSRYFVRNYYDDDQGDHEMVMWNIHYRPYDWSSSNYLSSGFHNSIKKYKPFNFSFDPKNYYNGFTNYLHFFEPTVKFIDYKVPNKLYFAQKFVYGSSVYHYKISSIIAPYVNDKHEVFKRFNPGAAHYEYYISQLTSKTLEFNHLKKQAISAHFKYFYFNRFRYYMSKVNPNSRLFSRVSFNNVGGWPVSPDRSESVDIYSYDYPLFMENIKYRMLGYEKRLELINHHYYMSIKRPQFSFYNMDLFYWVKANIEKKIFSKDSSLSIFEQYEFLSKKFLIHVIYSGNKNLITEKLFDLEIERKKLEQSKRYSFYWTFFWNKTTSKIFDKNSVALPSSALLLNPNYLPVNYNNMLAARRHHLDSIRFNSRLFSRKQFKRFWFRSTFVPLIDSNPVKFSERFHNFKSYESGLPVSPTFSKRVSDPLSKFVRRGLRRPIMRESYANFLITRYYKNFFNGLADFDKTNNLFSEENTNFLRFTDTNLFTSEDLRAFNNYSYEMFFAHPYDYNVRKDLYFNNLYAATGENSKIFKFLYTYDLINKAKFKDNNKFKRFFDGQNSRYYLRQIYRYPFSRSNFRLHYDAVNDNNFFRNNVIPGYSHYIIFGGQNLLPYAGVNSLKTPQYSEYVRSYEDRSTSITNYFRGRFNKNAIGNYRKGQYNYINDSHKIGLYRANKFKWGGRHTRGFNSPYFRTFRRNYNLTRGKLFSSNFNSFPIGFKPQSNLNSKIILNLLTKLSSRETKVSRFYNINHDWPGNLYTKEPFRLRYPHKGSFYLDRSYIGTSSITHGKGMYPYYTRFLSTIITPDVLLEAYETTPEIFSAPYLIRDIVMKTERRHKYRLIRKRLRSFNLSKSVNMGLFNPIDFINVDHPRSLISSRKNGRIKHTNFPYNRITKVSETPYFLRSGGKSKDVKFSLSVKANLGAYFYGLDRTPIYSKNYSKRFQKKDAFLSFNIVKINVIRTYSWGDEAFNDYVKSHYLLKAKKVSNKSLDEKRISKIYENSYSDQKDFKKNNIEFFNYLKYSQDYISPLENYIMSSYDKFSKFYMHSPFPFTRHGRTITNIINSRRDVYKSRITARLQKYIASDAFEKTYSRVFSGSRVPVTNKDPIEFFAKGILKNDEDFYPAFEIWADKSFNDNLTLKEIKEMVKRVKRGQMSRKTFITRFRKVAYSDLKFVKTYNIDNSQNFNVKEKSFNESYHYFYSHVNISDMLFRKLKDSRLYNPKFMNEKDLEFFARNSKLLAQQAKDFRPSRPKIFSRQTPASLRVHEYVINRSLIRNKRLNEKMHITRIELDKFRPGSTKKQSFVLSKNISNYAIYPIKDGKTNVPTVKKNEFLAEFEKENIKAAQIFNKKKTTKKSSENPLNQ